MSRMHNSFDDLPLAPISLRNDLALLDWLETAHTLHKAVAILYVVDGYTCTLTYDSDEIAVFHGPTMRVALGKAMDAYHAGGITWEKK